MDRLDYAVSGVASVINVAARNRGFMDTRRREVTTDDRHLWSSTEESAVRVGNR